MRNKVSYEYKVECIDEHGDIIDSYFETTLLKAISTMVDNVDDGSDHHAICLVRDEGNDIDGLVDRQHKYLYDNNTWVHVVDSQFDGGAEIPLKHLRQIQQHGGFSV